MKCIVCDLNSVNEDGGEDAEDDLDLELVYHRKLLLSIFCKYFNWENNYDLTPSQLLSWIPSSSSSVASNFPFCTKCEERLNELNDLHNSLAHIQLGISSLISSMSVEIIKVAESSSFSTSQKSKHSISKSPITTAPTSIDQEDKGVRSSSRRRRRIENEVITLDDTDDDEDDDGSKSKAKYNSKSLAKSKSQKPKSVGEFRKNIYKRFKPQVIVEDCKKAEDLEPKTTTTSTTNTTTTQSSNEGSDTRRAKLKSLERIERIRRKKMQAALRRQEREEKDKDEQTVVDVTLTSTSCADVKGGEFDPRFDKGQEAVSPAHGDNFDDDFSDDDDDDADGISTGSCQEGEAGNDSQGKGDPQWTELDDELVKKKYQLLKYKKGHKNLSKAKLMELARASPARPTPQTEEEKDEKYAQRYYYTVKSKKEFRKYKNAPKSTLIEIARSLRPKDKPKKPPQRRPPTPTGSTSSSEEEPFDDDDDYNYEEDSDKDDRDKNFAPYFDKPKDNSLSNAKHRATETEPGSNIFRYYNWEFVKISADEYKCKTCNFHCRKGGKASMLRHINRHHNDVIPKCNACQRTWATEEMKNQHVCRPKERGPRPKTVKEISPGKFLYLDKYLYQKVDGTSNEEGYEYMCLQDNCFKLLRWSSSVQQHIKKFHDGSNLSYMCDICGKTGLASQSKLESHKAIHSDARNEICDVCGKSFKTRNVLRNHRLIHKGPFICGYQGCTKEFSVPPYLKRHRIAAGHPAETPQHKTEICPNCGRKFAGEANLAKHMASLSCVIQRVNCQYCGKEYASASLRDHQRRFCPENPTNLGRLKRVRRPEPKKKKKAQSGSKKKTKKQEVETEQPPASTLPPSQEQPAQPEVVQPVVVEEQTTGTGEQEPQPQTFENTNSYNINFYVIE